MFGSCIIHILYTGCAKIKKNNSDAKRLNVLSLKFMFILQSGFLLARLVKHTTENFATEEDAEEVEAFFVDHPSPGTERTVQQSCESIRLNAAWLRRDRATTREYLSSGK